MELGKVMRTFGQTHMDHSNVKVIKSNQLEKKETVIIEDSPVGVQAGIAAGINVIGITAGSHWTQNRSDKHLIDSGAIHVISNFKYLDKILKDL